MSSGIERPTFGLQENPEADSQEIPEADSQDTVEGSRVRADLAREICSVGAQLCRVLEALRVRAPGLARRQVLDTLQNAQGSLMRAEELAIQHVHGLATQNIREVLIEAEKG